MKHSGWGWAWLAASALGLAGCHGTPEPPSTPDPVDIPDAGPSPWPTLPEPGDAVDPGPLAPCSYPATSTFACGEQAAFELTACNRGSLSAAPTQGVFILNNRFMPSSTSSQSVLFANAMHLLGGGNTPLLTGAPATTYERDAQSFFLRRDALLSDGTATRTAYVGCQLSGAQHLTGCFVTCRNGQVRSSGTFEALRASRRDGEQEAEGLALVSESFISLGLPVDVYVAKEHAYVVSLNANGRTGGLSVFDVADRAHPVFQGTVTMPGDSYWNGVWSAGDALYVASASRGVLVFDIHEPSHPQFVRSLPEDSIDVHTVLVEADRLYAMSPDPHSETLLFDISQPLAPALLQRFTAPGGDTTGFVHDAFAYQGRLYINHWDLGYVIADVSNPAQVRQVGRYRYAHQSSHANAVGTFAGRTVAFEGGESYDAHLRVLDVSNPAHVVKVGEFHLRPQSSIHNMVLVGSRLYVAWYQEGVRVLEVSEPSQPQQRAYFNTFRETDFQRGYSFYEGAIGIRVPGDGYVYTVDTSRGLLILREQ